jgi:acyl-CoA thioesterase-2
MNVAEPEQAFMTNVEKYLPKETTPARHRLVWEGLRVADLVAVERIGGRHFRSRCSEDNRNGRVFGGQLLGQALNAAQACVPQDRTPSSLQVTFMQGALLDAPIDYRIVPLQEGKRFSSVCVMASQGERGVIEAHVTFSTPIASAHHMLAAPADVPAPEHLASLANMFTLGERYRGVDWPHYAKPCVELRVADPGQHLVGTSAQPRMAFWVRLRVPLDDLPATHAAALAYLSDYWINSAAITHHIPARDAHAAAYIASLNHSLWMHTPGRADGWLLFVCESPAMQQGRALTHARIYDSAGVLLASVAQECLFVPRQEMAMATVSTSQETA